MSSSETLVDLKGDGSPEGTALAGEVCAFENPNPTLASDGGMEEHKSKVAQRITTMNKHGEELVGILHEVGSKDLVILCHGYQSSKERKPLSKVSEALVTAGISNFRFDFSGNGESGGQFQFGNYWKEVDDLRAVILHFLGQGYQIRAIIGHSKAGNVVLLYASKYHDISKVVNISGRFDMNGGLEGNLGKDFLPRMKSQGYVDVLKKNGEFHFRVTEENLMERLSINMHDVCLSIAKDCRVLTVHGSEDEIIPVGDGIEIGKLVPNHSLIIIEGSNHSYYHHLAELSSSVLGFV